MQFKILIPEADKMEASLAIKGSLQSWHERLVHQNTLYVKQYLKAQGIQDDYSHYRTVYFLRSKDETVKRIKDFIVMTSNHVGRNIKTLRTDNGLEMVLLKGRIALVEAMRTMIHAKNLPLRLWAESINTAAYVINRTRTSPQRPKTPYELWFGQRAKLGKLFPFGTTAYAHIPKEKRRKLDKKAEKGHFVGYNEDVKGFRIWFSETDKVDTKRDVIFKENDHSPAFSTENKKDDDLQTFRFLEEPAIQPQNYQPQEPEPQIFEKSEESIDEEESDGDDDWDSANDPFDPED
ncbi:retrovirus-related pol polyprotein from transposon tnt 1-94 [Lasius niger]|uniref:Retrovirus-related pol polyprotein from transposon tnt 1-94 n=1 Tax=Lasius niger TaxID=67767 RepID=A0A0J7K8Q1_LASNI|nr:retrovirus-related pol polyprotein from transposon tnt 1-94 [Lasius niger]